MSLSVAPCCRGFVNLFGRYLFPTFLHTSGNRQQGFQFGRNRRETVVLFDGFDKLAVLIAPVITGNGTVNRLAKKAVVFGGNVRGNQLAFGAA
jgi:hypothetical protein